MDSVPAEIICKIAKHLGPPEMPTCVPWSPDFGTVATLQFNPESILWEDWTVQRRDLVHLSLVSRRYRDSCERFLWRNIALSRETGLGLEALCETLEERPGLGYHVKAIYIKWPLSSWPPFYGTVIDRLISLTPNVEDIFYCHLRSPDPIATGMTSVEDLLPSLFSHAYNTLLSGGVSLQGAAAIPEQPLPRLKTFRFRGEIGQPMASGLVATDMLRILPLIPSITTLEFWREGSRTWGEPPIDLMIGFVPQGEPIVSWPQLGPEYPRLHNITTIRLFGTHATEHQVASLVRACPRLEELEVKFIGSYSVGDGVDDGNVLHWLADFVPGWPDVDATDAGNQDIDPPLPPRGVSISTALGEVSDTLRSVSVTGCGCGTYLCRQIDVADDDKRPEVFTLSLHGLTNLNHLTVDLWGLFGNMPRIEEKDIGRFKERIPHSVTSLKIVMDWDLKGDHVHWASPDAIHIRELLVITKALTELVQDGSRRIRKLSLVHERFPRGPIARAFFEDTIDKLHRSAREAGVENFETAEAGGWSMCTHSRHDGAQYFSYGRRQTERRGVANALAERHSDGTWAGFPL